MVTMDTQDPPAGSARLKRLLPLAALAAIVAVVFIFDLDRYVSIASLERHRAWLKTMVAEHWLLTAAIYVGAYLAVAALSIPGGLPMTLAGGFLFGAVWGTVLVVIGATAGGTILFLVARTALGDGLVRRAGPWLARLEEGFRRNAWNYLLFLRLLPLFPFWVINLAAAALGVSLRTFVLATAVGIIPATYVYATIGAGLGVVIDRGDELSLADALTPEIVLGLLGLALLALLPVVYKSWRGRRIADPTMTASEKADDG